MPRSISKNLSAREWAGAMPRAAVFLGILLMALTGCVQGIRVAQPLLFAEDPAQFKRENLSIAVVRDSRLVKYGKEEDPALAPQVSDAITQGLAQAARALATRVDVVERGRTSGYDLVVTPANFYQEGDASRITMSMDITIMRVRDGKEFGILAEASGNKGIRPLTTYERNGHVLDISGVYLKNGPYGQALNNTIFYLAMDFLKKLDRRLDSLR